MAVLWNALAGRNDKRGPWEGCMACDQEELRHVPLFALLDDDELAVLAGQVEMKKFAARQRIYKMGKRVAARTFWCPAACALPPWTRIIRK
jgi:hypothetical protein